MEAEIWDQSVNLVDLGRRRRSGMEAKVLGDEAGKKIWDGSQDLGRSEGFDQRSRLHRQKMVAMLEFNQVPGEQHRRTWGLQMTVGSCEPHPIKSSVK
jgi:hypothetical protein